MQAAAAEILKQYWGYDSFRPLQAEIVDSVLSGKDTIALLPTGGGKSICFQVPALVLGGLTLVVSPLISLMKDQVENLNRIGISAIALYGGMSRKQMEFELENARNGKFRLIYISPERLAGKWFREWLPHMPFRLIAVDEAHCVSQWGYDFRPEYLRIAEVRELLPKVPVLALTATATPEVLEDIDKSLLMKEPAVFKGSFHRDNLSFSVNYTEQKEHALLGMVNRVKGSGIIFTNSRKKTESIAVMLRKNGISAEHYHAGLLQKERAQKQESWKSGKVRVMVSTNAFGMGIDKSDVRFVYHESAPQSPEAYFQEAGRAGRDGKKSWCVLLRAPGDEGRELASLHQHFPTVEKIEAVYTALVNHYKILPGQGMDFSAAFDIAAFCTAFNFRAPEVQACLKMLEQLDFITTFESLNNPSRIRFLFNYNEVYDLKVCNPKLEKLLDTLMRSYGGIFDHYVSLDEKEIARRMNTTEYVLETGLDFLHRSQVLEYIPAPRGPQIMFVRERPVKFECDTSLLRFLYDRAADRIHAMIRYAGDRNECRSAMLCRYFGEESRDCGICDNCLEKRRKMAADQRYTEMISRIENELKNGPAEILQLREKIPASEKTIFAECVRWLTDEGMMQRDEQNRLIWKKGKGS